ncbi:MAG: 3-oxoacyl-[acyl-carrier-protein] reductase [Deltaproteobacteria bacterium]|nr:3-oxoacyl-[acyl-carrier-protein] reductase [Deltaproteobacteria bacterium]
MEQRTALVTGGSRGIGRAIAVRLAREGIFTVVNYRKDDAAAEETLAEIQAAGGQGKLLRFDVAGFQETQEAIQAIVAERGRLDILVNNAGRTADGLIVRQKEADWDLLIDTNLKGVLNCCRAATRTMLRQEWGRIVNITSIVAEAGNAGQAAYSASKAGVIGLTKALARELGSRNICVNAVSPGWIGTAMTESLTGAQREALIRQIPLGRPGLPEEVAAAVAFLASEEAGYITGQVLRVNGGLYL